MGVICYRKMDGWMSGLRGMNNGGDNDKMVKNAIICGTYLINCLHIRNDAECNGNDDNDGENVIVMMMMMI